MPEFPTGVVTLVFTDIEGSSALWEAHNQAFAPVLAEHNRIMRAAAAQFNGCEVKTEGDAFFLAFSAAGDAVRFAVEAQLSLQRHDWNKLLRGLDELRVRIGMHTGEPILSAHPDGTADYFGPVVNRAARVGGAGYGGQILVSDATKTLAETTGLHFEDLGKHRLKGVGEETLWQVLHPDLASRFPALKTLAGAKHNLPPELTPFVGRAHEVEEWSLLLNEPQIRLLTLCGFGGQGKTRIALEIAEAALERFADGVWWVELEQARDGEAMIARIAHELRLHLQPKASVREQLVEFLRERQVLLVLDNTEQIPDAGDVINELLTAAPDLKCLVTTRRALDIRIERVVSVPPLPIEQSVELFVERARSRAADFSVTPKNKTAIEALCQALEGVPLAIELAASRLAVLSPAEMLERLDERFKLLQTRAPDLPTRQRALRGAIDWSYELLGEEEKDLLAMLSVFEGGFTLAAAETVSDDLDALEGVAQLQRHSFLRVDEQDGQKRFSMLASVHAYAAEKFGETADKDEVCRRHAKFYLTVAEKCANQLRGKGEAVALSNYWKDRANIGRAFKWAQEAGETAWCARLALAQYELLYRHGLWEEARDTVQLSLESVEKDNDNPKLLAPLQLRLASLSYDSGDTARASSGAHRALELAQGAGDNATEAEALNLLGLLALGAKQNDEARDLFEQSLQKRTATDQNGRAVALHNLALLAAFCGEAETAEKLYLQALEHRRRGGDTRGEAETLGNLGVRAHLRGDYAKARKIYQESLALSLTLRDQMGIALMLHNLGELALEANEDERAATFLVHSQEMFAEIGSAYSHASQPYLDQLREKVGEQYPALIAAAKAAHWQEILEQN